jgi:hypothetical protein
MTAQCERCSPRLGELLQWEIENPTASPAAPLSNAPSGASAAPQVLEGAAPRAASPLAAADSRTTGDPGEAEDDQAPASPTEMRELWLHAQECAECKSALDVLRSARQVLAALPLQTAPPDLRARVRAQLEASPQAVPTAVQAPSKSGEPEMLVSAAPAASLPWWRKMLGANATVGERPFVKKRRAPRMVWAGGGAVVAAFGLALALQIQPPSFGPPSQTSSDAASSAPAPSVGSTQNEAGRRSTSAGTNAKQPTVKAGTKAPAVTRAKPGPAAPATGAATAAPGAPTEDVPDTSSGGAPGGATANDSGSNDAAPNDPTPPEMPDVPPPPAVATEPTLGPPTAAPRGVVRRDAAGSALRVAAAPSQSATSKKRTTDPGSKANASRNAGTVIVARELPAVPRRETAVSEGGGRNSEGAAPTARSVAGAPSVAESAAESTQRTAHGAAPESHGSDSAAGGAAAGTFSSEAAASAADQSDRNVPESVGAAPQRTGRTRSARPDVPSVPAPAPPMVGAAAPQSVPENAREAESGAPRPKANQATRSQINDGRGAALERITALEARPAAPATRRASVEVKSGAPLSRARIEVSLAEGWRFARGGPSKRTVWTGVAKRGQAIRVEIEIEPSRANPPARAARVRLVDTANSARPREVASAVLLLAPAPSDSAPASSSR